MEINKVPFCLNFEEMCPKPISLGSLDKVNQTDYDLRHSDYQHY